MNEKLAFGFLLIHLQGSIEDGLKVGWGGSVGVGLGHVLRRVVGGREMEGCNLIVNPRYNPNDDDRYGRRKHSRAVPTS